MVHATEAAIRRIPVIPAKTRPIIERNGDERRSWSLNVPSVVEVRGKAGPGNRRVVPRLYHHRARGGGLLRSLTREFVADLDGGKLHATIEQAVSRRVGAAGKACARGVGLHVPVFHVERRQRHGVRVRVVSGEHLVKRRGRRSVPRARALDLGHRLRAVEHALERGDLRSVPVAQVRKRRHGMRILEHARHVGYVAGVPVCFLDAADGCQLDGAVEQRAHGGSVVHFHARPAERQQLGVVFEPLVEVVGGDVALGGDVLYLGGPVGQDVFGVVLRVDVAPRQDVISRTAGDAAPARSVRFHTVVHLVDGFLDIAAIVLDAVGAELQQAGVRARLRELPPGIARNRVALEAAAELLPGSDITFARGFEDSVDTVDPVLIAEAAEAARAADVAVVFAGLPDSYESEGYDRTHLRMPMGQEMLIEAVAAANPNTVVVLHNGSAIEMPWIDKVKGVLEAYLGGQAVGRAEIRILYGMANPSGRLAESFPLRLEDTPCYLDFGGEDDIVRYSEGVFVGYRYYTSRNMPVLFPFGYGLSYTDFSYSNLHLSADSIRESEPLTVSVDVTNTGSIAGAEVVQLYIGAKGRKPNGIIRPVRELRGFDKIYLEPGETKTVTFTLDSRAFAVWNTTLHDWYVDTREYTVEICANAFDVLLSAPVNVTGEKDIPYTYNMNSIVGRLMHDPKGAAILANLQNVFGGEAAAGDGEDSAVSSEMAIAMMEGMPLRSLPGFVDTIKKPMLQQLIDMLNAKE